MKSLWAVDGKGGMDLHPHRGQARVWESTRRFVAMISGTQSGKTSFGPLWLWREIEMKGAGDYLAATTSYDLFKLKMLPEMRNFFEHGLGIGRYWAGDGVIEIRDPATGKFLASRSSDAMYARIILRSAAAGSGLESATAKAAWLDEAGQDEFTLESWEAVLRRLSLSQGRVLVTTTPYNLGWMKTEIYDRWAAGDKDYDVIQFESTYNPAFPRAEYERAQRTMQAWRFAMFYQGLFTRPAGLIYTAFRDEMLVDDFEIPPSWERVIGIDFGGANTAVVHLANKPKTNVWYVYHESLGGGVTTEAHVKEVRALLGGVITVTAVGGAPGETQERRDWSNAGLRVEEPRIPGVEPGIDRVSGMFASGRLLVFRGLRGLRDELGSYRRRLDSDGNPLDEIVDKRHFHRLDALRYACSRVVDPGGWARGPGG